jgi:hypothetical protein
MDFIELPAQTISPLPDAGASCLVTSASFGAAGLQAKLGADVLLTCAP